MFQILPNKDRTCLEGYEKTKETKILKISWKYWPNFSTKSNFHYVMGVTPVRALNSIKIGGIGGVANNPVVFRILRFDLVDSILSKRRTFLAEDF